MIDAKQKNWKKVLYRKLISSQRWRRLSFSVKKEHRFLCQDCQEKGVLRPATQVHHIRPAEWTSDSEQMKRVFFDRQNLRCLCEECHIRTHKELGRGGKKRTEAAAAVQLDDDNEFWFGNGQNR